MAATLTVPSTPDELEEMLGDDKQLKDLLAEGKLGDLVKNYAQSLHDKDSGIAQQIKDEVQRVTAEMLRENKATRETNDVAKKLFPGATAEAPNRIHNKKAPGAKADHLFEDTASYLSAIWHRATSPEASAMQGELHKIRNSFGSTVPADGGFLIPEALRSELLRVSLETAIVRPRARTVPMDSLTVPFPSIDSSSNASNIYGGVTAYWTEEAAELQESSAKFGRIKLEAKKLTGYTEVPNELFTDSIISLQMFINEVFPEALAWFEDIAFMRGSGAGEPLGFLNSKNTAAVSVAKEGSQVAATILWQNIVKMFARMLPTSLARAAWIVNIDCFPTLALMSLDVGTGGSAIWLNNGQVGPPMTILGRPVVFTEKAETVGTVGDINFVDLGYYLIGDRQAMAAATSDHYKFRNQLTAISFTERVDGRPWLQSPITPNKGSNTLSPFVKLATRA